MSNVRCHYRMSINKSLSELNFHDSTLVGLRMAFGEAKSRSCALEVDYYDWEGNNHRRTTDPAAPWQVRPLTITFGFVAHIEFSAPSLIDRAQDLDIAQLDYELERFSAAHREYRQQFPTGSYPLFGRRY